MLLLQLGIVLGTLVLVAACVMAVEMRRVQDAAFDEVATVARELVVLTEIQHAFETQHPETIIAPMAKMAQQVSGVDYVTVADMDGIRLAHPNPAMIGKQVSSNHELVRDGQSFRGIEDGTLGMTLRVKEPIWDQGTVVGTVSVGILQSKTRMKLADIVGAFAPWILLAGALGTVGAAFASRKVRKIYGVDPDQVHGMLQAREAVLYAVGDGVIGVDEHGRLSLANREAIRLLGLPEDAEGRMIEEVLEPSMVQFLRNTSNDRDVTENVLSGERVLIATRREATVSGQRFGSTLTLKDRTELENTLRELRGQRGLTDTLRAQAHEFTNRLHLISGLLSIGEVDEAEAHIQRFVGPHQSDGVQLLEDPTLGALLSAKLAVAHEAGVELRVLEGSHTGRDWVSDEDTVTVISNLISNAIEAAGDGGTVQVQINANGRGLRAVVEDTGPGIDDTAQSKVLELGFSSKRGALDPLHERGIGLTLVDRIVRRRAGVLHFKASSLGGAMVIAAWPLRTRPAGWPLPEERR
ncbi:ATP-binding protein [Glutamicibacter arilaitensis]|uniref:sensor histidine kinase n=1 Tax=Glutamicibacter arilaitensis TaxID=256701 RepID=UPI00384A5AB3